MAGDDDAPIELVESAGVLDGAVALLRDFVHDSGALRAVGVVEQTDGAPPAVVDCGRMTLIEVDLGERVLRLPHGVVLDADVRPLPGLRRLPPFDVDATEGTVTGMIGGLDQLVANVRALAEALGGTNVAMAVFETTDAAAPLAITARSGDVEPVVVSLGEDQFEWTAPDQPPPAAA